MKFRMIRRMNKLKVLFVALLMSVSAIAMAQVPEAPNPPKLVNDLAGIFTPEQVKVMEDSLVAFSKKTSNQIVVVTMNDLGGMDKAQMAYEIGDKWGVGGKHEGKKLNNGVVVLIKPKNETRGEAFIATGYGVEGVLPDATAKHIVENEMIPSFKENDYYEGVNAALNVIKPLLAKEYTFEEYEDDLNPWWAGALVLLMAIGLFFLFVKVAKDSEKNNNDKGNNSGTFGGGLGTGLFLGGLGNSSGSSSGSGFGGGGFGGFGGGGFGGGGAGGSW